MSSTNSIDDPYNKSDAARPDYVRPEAAVVRDDLNLIEDLLAGTRRMWDKSAARRYIRKWADEKQTVYDIRRRSETLFEGLGRTVSAAVGMLFATPPRMVWNKSETEMQPQWDNIDGAGTSGPVFAKRFADIGIRDGIAIVLVDHPRAPANVAVTAADEEKLGLRPQWARYTRKQVMSWRTEVVHNRQTVTQLVLEESGALPMGTYGVKEVKRYRVLTLGKVLKGPATPTGTAVVEIDYDLVASWELFEQNQQAAGEATFKSVAKGQFRNKDGDLATFLPIAIGYTGRSDAPLCSTIPLLGVAWANLSHWQLATNLRFYRDLAAFPQPVIVGEIAATQIQAAGGPPSGTAGKVAIGPAVAVHLKGAGSSYDWKGPPTEAFQPLENALKEKKADIGQMGLSFLTPDTRVAETAEAKRLDATVENSTLATAAQGIEDALNLALQHHAWYLGIAKEDAPTLTLNRDYESTVMDSLTMNAYITACKDIGFPVSQLLQAFQQGGRIPLDVDLEALEMEMMANAAAEAARAAQVAKDNAAAALGNVQPPPPAPTATGGNGKKQKAPPVAIVAGAGG